jgi:hypothetical protein
VRSLDELASARVGLTRLREDLAAVVAATITYELSHPMAFAARNETRGSPEAITLATAAVRLGPGTYDALSTLSVNLAGKDRPAQQAVNADLLRRFPHVPLVLYQAAIDASRRRELEPALRFATHAVANGPDLKPARDLLDSLTKLKAQGGAEAEAGP